MNIAATQNQTFWTELQSRIAKYDLLCHPFYKAWTEGSLTREDLREYAADYYHHVSAFPTYLSAFHARLADGALRREVLKNLADEEGVDAPDGKPHSELWLDFAQGMGAGRATVHGQQPVVEVQSLIAHFRRTAERAPIAAALASFYVYESQAPRVATEKAKGLKATYGADAATCRYFTLHQTADVHHSNVWKQELEKTLAAAPDQAEAALAAAEDAAKALWTALDGIERERQNRRARAPHAK